MHLQEINMPLFNICMANSIFNLRALYYCIYYLSLWRGWRAFIVGKVCINSKEMSQELYCCNKKRLAKLVKEFWTLLFKTLINQFWEMEKNSIRGILWWKGWKREFQTRKLLYLINLKINKQLLYYYYSITRLLYCYY